MVDSLENKEKVLLQKLEKEGVVVFVPSGNSMWPFIKDHKNSVTVSNDVSDLDVYDVVLYQRDNGKLVLHRIVKKSNDGFIVCGDSQLQNEIVNKNQIKGVVTFFSRNNRLISAKDKKYLEKVNKYYKRSKLRKLKIKMFNIKNRITKKIKYAFKKTGE